MKTASYILEGHKPADRFGFETNDCTVNALANVTGRPYPVCHAYLKAAGRKDKHGFRTYSHFGNKSKIALGYRFTYIDLWDLYKGQITLARFRSAYPRGNYLVCISRHALCVKNGVIVDSIRATPRSRVKSAWLVEKIDGPIVAPAPRVVVPAVAPVAPAPAGPTLAMRKIARGTFKATLTVTLNRGGSTRQVLATLRVAGRRARKEQGLKEWSWWLSYAGFSGGEKYELFVTDPTDGYRTLGEVKKLFAEPGAALRNWIWSDAGWNTRPY